MPRQRYHVKLPKYFSEKSRTPVIPVLDHLVQYWHRLMGYIIQGETTELNN